MRAAYSRVEFGIVGRTRPGRSDGGSAVGAAAYNLCSRLDHGARAYDFRRKDAEHVGGDVLLPPGASPALRAPGALWQAAEQAERRVDAQTARQVLVSLPRECPPHLRLDLARAIAAPWVADGMGAQLDVHCTRASDGGEQPHLHILLTLRRVSDAGFAPVKERGWNQQFRADQGRTERARIATTMSDFLAMHGVAATVDHRSLAARGEARTPEPRVPQAALRTWQRAGADPASAPPSVAAVIVHRGQRQALAEADSTAAAATAEAADLAAQLAALPPEPTPPAAQPQPQPEPKKATAQETIQMPPRPIRTPAPARRAPSPRQQQPEPWMRGRGGLDTMPAAHRASAERSYARWTQGRPDLARKHALRDYVDYVQDRHAEHAEQPAQATVATAPGALAPVSSQQAHQGRRTHLAAVLADRYPQPTGQLAALVQRIQVDQASRVATLHVGTSRIIDHGDRLEHDGDLTDQVAQATAAAAAAHGWQSVQLTGPQAYRDAVAIACALHEPPIITDHALSHDAAERVATILRERAVVAVPAIDADSLQQLAAHDPAAAARVHLDHAEARARAALAGRPGGSTIPADLARARLTEITAQRDDAREDAVAARAAVAAHAAENPWTSRLLDPAARARHAALTAEAARLTGTAVRLDRDYTGDRRAVLDAADRQARQHATAQEAWRWSPATQRAQADLARLAAVRQALDQDHLDATAAAARGDLRAAARAAAQPASTTPPADPRDAAVRRAAAAEQRATSPDTLAQARTITAAAVAGDPATVAAVVAGNQVAAQRAAAEHLARQAQEAAQREQERQARIQAGQVAEVAPAAP